MFGHDNKDNNQSTSGNDSAAPAIIGHNNTTTSDAPTGTAYSPTTSPEITPTTSSSDTTPPADNSTEPTSAPAPDLSSITSPTTSESDTDPISSVGPTVTPVTDNDSDDQVTPTDTNSTDSSSPADEGLLNLKQQALQQLKPLVSELDQSPEETFHTVMMMIQASDDQSLIEKAYAAADQISDKKAKAQALLDIVNEINYFTHPSAS